MRIVFIMIALMLPAGMSRAVAHAQREQLGQPTTIAFAGGGGITQSQPDRADRSVIYLRDRRLKWYRVGLAGPCVPRAEPNPTMAFTTDPTGTFDTFSTVSFPRYPGLRCAVKSIVYSAPPQGQPGAPTTRR